MKYLIVDTSSRTLLLSASNGKGDINLSLKDLDRHGSMLAVVIKQSLDLLEISPADLDFLGAGVGPGSLTGLRVGLSTIKGLSLPHNIPVAPFNSLGPLAEGMDFDDFVICRKGREGHFYWRAYLKKRPGETLFSSTAEIKGKLDKSTIVCSERTEELADFKEYRTFLVEPSPTSMQKVALEAFRSGKILSGIDLEPVYLQKSVAELNWDRRNPRKT
ncbi:MAG TPA: tRNA (adenosine(37)-N6)-threonylcarbamoyltransferase complex dimerization subunit type 1 TsaB [Mesotoga sp.]|jgi:tRNA threonylcarbamoyl adenosine modification protein YeaZ|nr:tRNA (adenosine(37)-N6)-threonylcarbamoyltransferase complex dimerization subunit type 1 TsaB [Mesotoga sp.]MDI9376509.1 tRNA (adenosine(37)-N6)-threonylcarbamoyltransferase complex dimerization subunit type 1 TsaB [Thermotogota bacterium]NLX34790.1 tRNA (adenosine(37)-N6)-threonylcarbamoyltransferase complex dimerization subunit type 1 TsaB [Thermotogaceae bacterium]MDD4040773.1 tRNA (adenosine(37)-N6)-threonylcarbamoyltransferase complex dimerization subunit type 1 TsaB [Mesotoga sp.]HOI63